MLNYSNCVGTHILMGHIIIMTITPHQLFMGLHNPTQENTICCLKNIAQVKIKAEVLKQIYFDE
jgi:hypothetical protein